MNNSYKNNLIKKKKTFRKRIHMQIFEKLVDTVLSWKFITTLYVWRMLETRRNIAVL